MGWDHCTTSLVYPRLQRVFTRVKLHPYTFSSAIHFILETEKSSHMPKLHGTYTRCYGISPDDVFCKNFEILEIILWIHYWVPEYLLYSKLGYKSKFGVMCKYFFQNTCLQYMSNFENLVIKLYRTMGKS